MPKKFFDIIPPDKKLVKEIRKKKETKKEKEVKKEKTTDYFWPIVCVVVLCLFGAVVFTYASLAKTQVRIWPRTEDFSLTKNAVIDPLKETSLTNSIIKGIVFKDQRKFSQEFSATGKAVKEEKAKGIIKLYNAFSDAPQALLASTRLISAEGKLFKTLKRVVIPGAVVSNGKVTPSSIDVEVIAAETGPEYNIGSSTFAIPGFVGTAKYTAFYGKSFSQMTGGYKGEVLQVTQKDIDSARAVLLSKLQKESGDFLKKQVSSEFLLLDSAIAQETVKEEVSVKVEAIADKFTLLIEVKSQGLAFKKIEAESLVKSAILSSISKEKGIQENTLKINYLMNNKDGGLTIDIDCKIYNIINLDNFKKSLLGRSIDSTQEVLRENQNIGKMEIEKGVFWQKNIPQDQNKIKLEIVLD